MFQICCIGRSRSMDSRVHLTLPVCRDNSIIDGHFTYIYKVIFNSCMPVTEDAEDLLVPCGFMNRLQSNTSAWYERTHSVN